MDIERGGRYIPTDFFCRRTRIRLRASSPQQALHFQSMLTIDDVLVARDFSSVSDQALRHALDLAARTEAQIHVLHAEVLHESPDSEEGRSPAKDLGSFRKELEERNAVSADALDAVPVKEVVRRDVSPGPAILNYAAEAGIDLIALGTHGRRGPSRILLGSVAEEVVRQAEQPVLTVRGKGDASSSTPDAIDRILVPVDFSDYSRDALRHAKEWASLHDASIDVLHVVGQDLHPAFYVGGVESVYDVEPDIEQKVLDKLDSFVAETGGPVPEVRSHVRVSKGVASNIVEFVEENAIDLVSTSTHGRTGLDRFLLGSVAEKIVRHVRCPVLTVKSFGESVVSTNADN